MINELLGLIINYLVKNRLNRLVNMRKIATVICAKCGKMKQLYGIRTEKINNNWYFTWSFALNADVAKREGYSDTLINETPRSKEDFPGCPYCHSKDMIYCHNCKKINCYNGEERFTCSWCGITGEVSNAGWGNLSGRGY